LLATISVALVERIFTTITPAIRHDLEWKALHGVIELSNTAELGVIAGDREAIAQAAADLIHDADVVAIHVTGDQGSVFDYGAVSFNWDTYASTTGKVIEHGNVLLAVAPVEIEGLAVGRVHLAISKRRLLAGQELRATLLWTAGIGGLLALGLALGFVQLYIAPLLRVSAEAFRKLEKATVAAIDAARLRSEFLANMSHEIRTPMNGIMGVTKLALGLPLDSAHRRYWEMIDTSSRGMLTIVNDVLDFSKIEAGKYELHPRVFDLRAMVHESTELLAERAEAKGIALTDHIADDVPHQVLADPDRIKQVLINLVGNAVKFTSQGEVRLRVLRDPDVDGQTCLRFIVSDTGCGISPESRSLLFQAFTQVDGSYVRQHGGTGLGLAIAKRLTELMRGTIGVESELGRGSEFWFTVVVDAAIAPSARPRTGRAIERRRIRTERPVLVVDDNEVNRFVAVEHLRQFGFTTEIATNGAEAVEAVKQKSYAAVLMDCQMPVMDGYTAAQRIRDWEAGRGRVPIIAVTAHALVGEREHVIAAGMDDYIPKPVRPSSLERALARWTGDEGHSSPPPAVQSIAPSTPQAVEAATDAPLHELDDDVEVSPRLAELFLRSGSEQLGELTHAIVTRDESNARALAHKLKGGLFAVGASSLAYAIETLRAEVADGDWSRADARMQHVQTRFARVLDAVREQAAKAQSDADTGIEETV
jgi:signal transduction histidine kinase/CheY-like chemotaxis protein/HPt (histidine-containing phosphotransfer) domain-containing protein